MFNKNQQTNRVVLNLNILIRQAITYWYAFGGKKKPKMSKLSYSIKIYKYSSRIFENVSKNMRHYRAGVFEQFMGEKNVAFLNTLRWG